MGKQRVTKILFWAAFGIFLAVSVPHIAWVFHEFEPQGNTGFDVIWWPLAYGFAIAIDAVVCWLSHTQSSEEDSGTWVTWVFMAALVMMSWYFNWIYAKAHDPAHPGANVWTITLLPALYGFPALTVGRVTPLLVSALPVFIIAYTYVLKKISHMKVVAAKSLDELKKEAEEAQERAKYQQQIEEARRGQGMLTRGLQRARELREELEKSRPETSAELDRVLEFFRDTPHLLTEEQHVAQADQMIQNMLKLKRIELARIWRIKAAAILMQQQQAQEPYTEKEVASESVPTGDTEVSAVQPIAQDTEELGAIDFAMLTRPVCDEGEKREMDPSSLTGIVQESQIDIESDTSERAVVPLDVAAQLLNYDLRYTRGLRSKGTLQIAPDNPDLVTLASVNALLRKRQQSTAKRSKVALHIE